MKMSIHADFIKIVQVRMSTFKARGKSFLNRDNRYDHLHVIKLHISN